MKWFMYAIHDRAAQVYNGPFRFQTDGQASRWFCDAATSAENEVGKHPEDYTMMLVGMWDDNTGIMSELTVQKVISGVEAVAALRSVKADNWNGVESNEVSNGA